MKSILVAGAIALVVFALVLVPQHILKNQSFAEQYNDQLKPVQRAELDLVSEMNRTLISLATLMLGAIGAIFFNQDRIGKLQKSDKIMALLTASFSGASISFGFISFETINWMLKSGFFNLDNSVVEWPGRAQYYSFILAAITLSTFLFLRFRED